MNPPLKKKNIIFDLHGVLFEHSNGEAARLNQFSPIQAGIKILSGIAAHKNTHDYRLFACTNWNQAIIEILKQEHPDILIHFDAIITPTQAQAKKPDPQIFRYVLDTYKLDEYTCLFIDDQESNVHAASSIHIEAIHAYDFEYLKKELVRFGVFIQ